MTDHILTEQKDGVLRLAFNRPEKKNAITFDMCLELAAALKSGSSDPAVRVALIHGAGEVFTAGEDLGDFLNKELPRPQPSHQFLDAIMSFEKPLVAAVNGLAAGIGATMLLHCDFVYCARGTRLTFPFINLALVPEAGSSYLLPRLAGYQRAAELLLLGEPFFAEQAKEIGLVNEVLAPDKLMDAALVTARKLAKKPPTALRLAKMLMKQPFAAAVREANLAELKVFDERLKSPEAKEAMMAFFENRKPDFSRFS